MKRWILFLAAMLILAPQAASARIYIPIDQPSDQKFPIAIPDLAGGGKGEEVADIIRNDMTLSGYFRVLSSDSFRNASDKEGIAQETIRFDFWNSIGAQALVKGDIDSAGGKLVVTLRLFDPALKQMLVGKQYRAEKKQLREVAHRFSDEIMAALTGIPGVFNTKIAYSAVTSKGRKEIYMMDMDGENVTALSKNKSLNLSPHFSPDGKQIVYTSYVKGSPDLYILTVGGKATRKITQAGTNITPTYSPDGASIAFASSIGGMTNLYTIASGGGTMRRLTTSNVIDIAPTYSPDGGQIIFSSERAGGLHVFKMSSSGGPAQRITFVGYQNDMPNWSPMGDKVVFAGREGGTFDVFIMNPDGSNIQRLTVGSGSNEHPSFSPDGRLITFSSTREGAPAVYLMRADGSNQTRISKGNGLLPTWGPQRRDLQQQQ